MRNYLVAVAAAGSIIAMPASAAPQKARGARQVQLIVMGVGDPVAAEVSESAPSPLPDEFRVHDLSRRYVEFRMAQELSAELQTTQGLGFVPEAASRQNLVAPTSAIAVPGWMRSGAPSGHAVDFTPGCTPQAYRPSGLLGRSAEARRSAYYGMMSAIACEHGIPTGLFDAMIMRESSYNPVAISPKRAFGFAQLMPGTAAELGVNPYDPVQNMRGGARYLRRQLDRFGQVNLALAAYNAGPGRIRNGMIPQIAETQAYVSNIIANWSRLTVEPYRARSGQPIASAKIRTAVVSTY